MIAALGAPPKRSPKRDGHGMSLWNMSFHAIASARTAVARRRGAKVLFTGRDVQVQKTLRAQTLDMRHHALQGLACGICCAHMFGP